MRYVLMISDDESTAVSPTEHMAMPEFAAWHEEMTRRGVLRGGVRLRPSGDATTVRVRGDEVLIADGPFAETKEQIGGYHVIECADLDEALEIAARHPCPNLGDSAVEVRPVWEA
ncbi:YciI family protein [Amycolatopsis anabasis]|uniref:YciI family protein n=1 Tax=Amycolatopsis anabasis TaxID=1840409 RepID=UPI00131BD8FA|nr:YciI family protein [Amycolatopsis anabasis]